MHETTDCNIQHHQLEGARMSTWQKLAGRLIALESSESRGADSTEGNSEGHGC